MSAVRQWLGEARSDGESAIPLEKFPVLAPEEHSGWYALEEWQGWRPHPVHSDMGIRIVLHAGDPIKPGDLEHVPADVRTQDEREARAAKPRETIEGAPRMIGSSVRLHGV